MSHTVYLVACTKEKASSKRAARDLYTSDWFTKARQFVESTGRPWRILSALYMDVNPATELEPYNFTLTQHDGNDRIRRQTWGKQCADVIARRTFKGTHFVILAGKAYREFLEPALHAHGFTTEAPLAHLGIGSQKKWFIDQTRPLAKQASLFESAA